MTLSTVYGTADVGNKLAPCRWAGSPRYAAQRLSRAIDDGEFGWDFIHVHSMACDFNNLNRRR